MPGQPGVTAAPSLTALGRAPARRMRRFARKLLFRTARDATVQAAGRSLLVIAPHPDDETLGCGGRILLARQAGTPVTVVTATDGGLSNPNIDPDELSQRRHRELTRAANRLELAERSVITLGYPDGELEAYVDELADDLTEIIARLRPDDVCVTCAAESHADHSAASRATRIALQRAGVQARLLEYPIWLWLDWPVARGRSMFTAAGDLMALVGRRRIEAVCIDDVRPAKQHALGAYTSQLGDRPLPADLDDYRPTSPFLLPAEVVRRALNGPEVFFVRD